MEIQLIVQYMILICNVSPLEGDTLYSLCPFITPYLFNAHLYIYFNIMVYGAYRHF